MIIIKQRSTVCSYPDNKRNPPAIVINSFGRSTIFSSYLELTESNISQGTSANISHTCTEYMRNLPCSAENGTKCLTCAQSNCSCRQAGGLQKNL